MSGRFLLTSHYKDKISPHPQTQSTVIATFSSVVSGKVSKLLYVCAS